MTKASNTVFTMKYLVILLCIVGPAFAAVTPDKPFIYSVGHSVARIRPDVLIIRFSVAASDQSQEKANDVAEAKAASVFKVLRDFSIPKSDIESANIEVRREYSNSNENKPQGFTVTRSFRINFRQIERVGALVNQLSAVKINSLTNITGAVSDASATMAELKLQALDDARKKAEQIANAAGMRVLGVHAISPVEMGDIEEDFLNSGRTLLKTVDSFVQEISPPPPEQTFVFPDVEFSASIHVIFYIGETQ